MGSLWQSQLVGHILCHLHSRPLLGFWVCSSKRKPKLPPASNHWTSDRGPTQGSQYHCFAHRWAFLRAALAGSKMQQNLRTSQGACRQAAGSQSGRHMVWRSCAQAAEDSPCLEDPGLDSGLLVGPSFGAGAVSLPDLWSDCCHVMQFFIQDFAHQMLFMYQRGLHDMQLPCGLLLDLKSMGCNAATTQNSTKDGKALGPGIVETVCSLRGHSETRNHDQYYSGPTRIKVICDE